MPEVEHWISLIHDHHQPRIPNHVDKERGALRTNYQPSALQGHKTNSKTPLRLIGAVILFIIFGALAGCDVDKDNDGTTSNVLSVPDLIGQKGDEAKEALAVLDLEHNYESESGSVWNAANWVVQSTDPKPGEDIDPGSTVTLHVVREQDFRDPNFDGSNQAEEIRRIWLENFGLGDDADFEDIGDGAGLIGTIRVVTVPEERHVVATVSLNADEADNDEFNTLALAQLRLLEHDDRTEKFDIRLLEFESADGKIIGTSDESEHRSETDDGLSLIYAKTACSSRADKEFHFGGKLHSVMGVLAEEIRKDSVFYKVEATVTNEYGIKEKGYVVECVVEGNDDHPKVTSFILY